MEKSSMEGTLLWTKLRQDWVGMIEAIVPPMEVVVQNITGRDQMEEMVDSGCGCAGGYNDTNGGGNGGYGGSNRSGGYSGVIKGIQAVARIHRIGGSKQNENFTNFCL